MKKRAVISLALALILCGLIAAPALAASYATVVGGWLRLRANPSYNAAIITSYRTGTVVTVLGTNSGWARVMTPDYRLGYMDMHFLHFGSTPPSPPDPTPHHHRTWTTVNRTAYVTSQNGKGVRLRNSPEVNRYNVMGLYPVGRTVKEIKVSNDGWSYIKIDAKYGYMMSQFLTTYSPPSPPSPPGGQSVKSISLNKTKPKVGDTLKVTVTPESAKYSVVWYRADTGVLLSTAKSYKVTKEDEGHQITVRVTDGKGKILEKTTHTVKPSSSGGGETPGEETISDISLNKTKPKVGDTLKVTVTPDTAKYSAVWYRADTSVLLSTAKTYKVTEEDVGHQITVRVTGSDGKILELTTHTVKTDSKSAPEESEASEGYEEEPSKPEEPETPSEDTESAEEKPEGDGGKPSHKPSHKPDKKPESNPPEDSEESGSFEEETP